MTTTASPIPRTVGKALGAAVLALAIVGQGLPATAAPLPPAPPPSEILDLDAHARLDWSVPDRFDTVWKTWRPSTSTYDAKVVNPDRWSVNLDGCASTAVRRIEQYVFTVRQPSTSWQRTYTSTSCRLAVTNALPGQGAYTATLKVKTDYGASTGVSEPVERAVTIRDYLIVSLGDSIASGEGNPDKNGSYSVTFNNVTGKARLNKVNERAQWQDRRCHRSAKSGPARAARSYENASPYTSVTFVSFACSGAELKHLISTRYAGIEPRGSTKVAAQISAVNRLVGPGSPQGRRNIDALLVSAGANDVDFSAILERCATNLNIGNSKKCVTAGGLAKKVAKLKSSYHSLASALRPLAAKEVYLTTYPANPFRGAGCEIFGVAKFGISGAESREIFKWGKRVNAQISAATDRHQSGSYRWNLVPDVTSAFSPHAYCDSPSWFVRYRASWLQQGDEYGTVHPNAAGQAAYRDLIKSAVVLDQRAHAYRRVTVTLREARVTHATRYSPAKVLATLVENQSGFTERRYVTVSRDAHWTPVPASVGTFRVDMYLPRSSPRHAIQLELDLQRSPVIKHTLAEAYGVGSYERTFDQGRYAVRYTITASTP